MQGRDATAPPRVPTRSGVGWSASRAGGGGLADPAGRLDPWSTSSAGRSITSRAPPGAAGCARMQGNLGDTEQGPGCF